MLKINIVVTEVDELGRKNSGESSIKNNILTENYSNLIKSKNPIKSNYITYRLDFLTSNANAVFI